MRIQHYARKKRQLKRLSSELQERLEQGVLDAVTEKLIQRVKQLYELLKQRITAYELRSALGAMAVLFGLGFSPKAQAQSFDTAVANPFNILPPALISAPAFADLDGDGDLDMMVGEEYGNIKYYENIGSDTAANFAAPVLSPFGVTPTYYWAFPALADLDGDGDIDLLVGEYYGNMKYLENTGTPNSPAFAAAVDLPFGLDSTSEMAWPTFADIDADGDLDLFVGQDYGVQFFENTGSATAPAFAAPLADPFKLSTATENYIIPTFADIDGDGDLDLFAGIYLGDIAYFENIGTATVPDFGTSTVINPLGITRTNYVALPAFADIDADGDLDLFVGEYYGDIVFFENTQFGIGLEELGSTGLSVFPNPASEVIHIDSDLQHTGGALVNAMGQTVQVVPSGAARLDLINLPAGTYILELEFKDIPARRVRIQKL